MRILVRGKNIEVTPALRGYAEKRLRKLAKFEQHFGEVQVTLTVEKDSHRIEVTIPIDGMILRGEETTGDMYASMDLVVEKLEKQLDRYKGKLRRRRVMAEGQPYIDEPLDEDEDFQIVRTKRFALKPMAPEEAVMQMNLLGHSFFVFTNAENEQVNVVYKRRDGNYGLIEPDLG
ncbi:MAG: ribosome-associated translation inhibitor RaiA [Candidatus Desulforudis sp.]|nr:ribosome-associated translation inhibitor RaiA [Desulforudis sp.]